MNNQLDLAWFEHRNSDEMIDFIMKLTADKPMCIGTVDDGGDCHILIFSDKPFSQEEAIRFVKAEGIKVLDNTE